MPKRTDTTTQLMMEGADGSTWDVMAGTQGLILGRGLTGVLFPSFEHTSADLIQGRRYTGTRFKPAEMSATFQVGDTAGSAELVRNGGAPRTGAAWLALDAAVRRAISPTGVVRFTATGPAATRRFLDVRIDSLDNKTDLIGDVRGFGEYDVEFISDSPFWAAETASEFDFSPSSKATIDYYGGETGSGKGTPLFISGAGESIDNALRNGGDVQAWPVWTITGPVRATVSVTGKQIETKLLAPREVLVIHTAPWNRAVTVDGNPAWDRLVSRQFAAVPVGDNPQVTITARDMGPGGGVRVQLRENYLGAW